MVALMAPKMPSSFGGARQFLPLHETVEESQRVQPAVDTLGMAVAPPFPRQESVQVLGLEFGQGEVLGVPYLPT